jgi:predicted nucleic acid-binding protein
VSKEILWDSGAVLALLDPKDENHAQAVVHLNAIADRPGFMTNYILVETHALLLRRVGHTGARSWLLSASLPVWRAGAEEETRARDIISRYDDKEWSLCDAISFAVMEMRGVKAVFSFDHHFKQYGRFEVLGA